MCGVVVLTGSWPTSGGNANVFSFQQGVDHIIQKGHLDHRRIHILGLQHLNTHNRSSSYSLRAGLKNSRTHKLLLQKYKSNLNEKWMWIQRWRCILFLSEGGEKASGVDVGDAAVSFYYGGAAAIITFKPATNSATGEVYCDLACQMCGKPLQQHRGKPHWPKKGKYGIFTTAYDLEWTQASDHQSII